MNNDETERILNDFISDEDKKIQKLIDTLERIEKAGTLDKLFEGAEDPSFMERLAWGHSYYDSDDFWETLQDCWLKTGQELQEAYEHLRKAKFFHSQTRERYQDLKSRESTIKNPILIKFIKDYEAYYGEKEDDRQAKKKEVKEMKAKERERKEREDKIAEILRRAK